VPGARQGSGGDHPGEVEQTRAPLVALFVMVALLLVIACANLAGLLLARAAARGRELAVRVSIGAGRLRILRQLLAESLLIGATGGLCGVVLARWSCDVLLGVVAGTSSIVPVDLPLDYRVLLFATAVSTLTSVGFGLLPALRASRVDPAETLNAYGRGIVAHDRSRLPLGRLLVVGQLALTVLLLSVAALFARTLQQLVGVHVGYDDQGVVGGGDVVPRPQLVGQRLRGEDLGQPAIGERRRTMRGRADIPAILPGKW